MLVCCSVAMGLATRLFFPLVVPRFDPAKLLLTEHMFYGLLPLVLITGIASNCTAVLNTFERFAWPALAPIVIPVAIVLGSWLLAGRYGIWILVYANVAGSLVHALLMIGMMESHGYQFRLRWGKATKGMREVAGQYGPILLSGLVASSGLIVDQAMAAALPSGSVSTLVYANRFVSVVLTILAGAIATAVTSPNWSPGRIGPPAVTPSTLM
jgi:putative peptidoglycan lipid II flippase